MQCTDRVALPANGPKIDPPWKGMTYWSSPTWSIICSGGASSVNLKSTHTTTQLHKIQHETGAPVAGVDTFKHGAILCVPG